MSSSGKSSVDLLSSCGNLFAADWNDETRMTFDTHVAEEAFSYTDTPAVFSPSEDNSAAPILGANIITGEDSPKKRKRDTLDDGCAAADDECGNR